MKVLEKIHSSNDIKSLNDGGRYGIDEIDKILDCIIELSKKRIDEADYRCPVCRKGRLEKDITAAYCTNSKCKAFANGGCRNRCAGQGKYKRKQNRKAASCCFHNQILLFRRPGVR